MGYKKTISNFVFTVLVILTLSCFIMSYISSLNKIEPIITHPNKISVSPTNKPMPTEIVNQPTPTVEFIPTIESITAVVVKQEVIGDTVVLDLP